MEPDKTGGAHFVNWVGQSRRENARASPTGRWGRGGAEGAWRRSV